MGMFYEGFLSWDLSIGADLHPPDHVFYFTVHDSNSYQYKEHFGLLESCETHVCKLRSTGYDSSISNSSFSVNESSASSSSLSVNDSNASSSSSSVNDSSGYNRSAASSPSSANDATFHALLKSGNAKMSVGGMLFASMNLDTILVLAFLTSLFFGVLRVWRSAVFQVHLPEEMHEPCLAETEHHSAAA